jgi:hypothetical protein
MSRGKAIFNSRDSATLHVEQTTTLATSGSKIASFGATFPNMSSWSQKLLQRCSCCAWLRQHPRGVAQKARQWRERAMEED